MEINNPTISLTRNYSKFNILVENRNVVHNPNLQKSMEKYGWIKSFPLTCRSSYDVIDGQHRLEIARKLDLEVPYCINDKIEKYDIPLIQCGRNWSMDDFLKHYATRGYRHYVSVKQALEFGNMKIGVFLRCFGVTKKGKTAHKSFKEGKVNLSTYDFEYIDMQINRLNEIKACVNKSRQCLNLDEYISIKATAALYTFISSFENYEHERFMHALDTYPDNIIEVLKFSTTENIINGCIALYNRNLKNLKKQIKQKPKKIIQ